MDPEGNNTQKSSKVASVNCTQQADFELLSSFSLPFFSPSSSPCLQDVLLNALDMKVTEVYHCCVDRRLTNLSTLEKLSCVEYRMSSLLEVIESIPKESLETLRQIKDSERRSRFVSLAVEQVNTCVYVYHV